MAKQWYRANDALGTGKTAIAGATKERYNTVPADNGKFIVVETDGVEGAYTDAIVEVLSGQIGLTKLAEYDFEAMSVGSQTSVTDGSGNGNNLTPNGAANFSIVNDGSRRGVQFTGTGFISLRNTNASFWKFLHDGTPYTIVFEGRIGNAADPNAIYGILGTCAATNTKTGISVFYDDRETTLNRNARIQVLIGKSVSGTPVIDQGQDNVLKSNASVSLVLTYENVPTNGLKIYTNRSFQGVFSRNSTPVTTNATHDFEIGAAGNGSLPFIGVIYRIIIYQGIVKDDNRIKIDGSRGALLDLYPINRNRMNLTDGLRYDSFHDIVDISPDEGVMVFRSGTDHLTAGRLDMAVYNYRERAITSRINFKPYANFGDYRDPRIGLINNRLYVASIRRNRDGTSGDSGFDVPGTHGYYRSQLLPSGPIDLAALVWEDFVSLPSTRNYSCIWGTFIKADAADTYYVQYWETDTIANGATWRIGYWIVTNDGTTWTKREVYAGLQGVTENYMQNLGGGKLLIISRIEPITATSSGLAQFTSTDAGATWSSFARTNLEPASNVANIPCLYYNSDTNTVTCLYHTRKNGWLYVSAHNPVATIMASPTAWKTAVRYENNNEVPNSALRVGLGYPSFKGRVAIWAKEMSDTSVVLRAREENFTGIN